jgi:hypothetical protein
MQNMVQVMELSPRVFHNMGEEDLRTHFLVQLNGTFKGQATGETFNFQGKIDILIRVEGKNVFIAECKFWKGEKALIATLDQLLSYLSWRDTKAALLVFNRNADFSGVLAKIRETVPTTPTLSAMRETRRAPRLLDADSRAFVYIQPNLLELFVSNVCSRVTRGAEIRWSSPLAFLWVADQARLAGTATAERHRAPRESAISAP